MMGKNILSSSVGDSFFERRFFSVHLEAAYLCPITNLRFELEFLLKCAFIPVLNCSYVSDLPKRLATSQYIFYQIKKLISSPHAFGFAGHLSVLCCYSSRFFRLSRSLLQALVLH